MSECCLGARLEHLKELNANQLALLPRWLLAEIYTLMSSAPQRLRSDAQREIQFSWMGVMIGQTFAVWIYICTAPFALRKAFVPLLPPAAASFHIFPSRIKSQSRHVIQDVKVLASEKGHLLGNSEDSMGAGLHGHHSCGYSPWNYPRLGIQRPGAQYPSG